MYHIAFERKTNDSESIGLLKLKIKNKWPENICLWLILAERTSAICIHISPKHTIGLPIFSCAPAFVYLYLQYMLMRWQKRLNGLSKEEEWERKLW